jgi:HD-GYP domain-containing protein (c-di-GMP phosphodiesterase class II)
MVIGMRMPVVARTDVVRTGVIRNEADELIAMATARMPDTVAHAERVARYADAIGRELGIPEEQLAIISQAARFHDIGKLAIPTSILNKPASLTAEERRIVRRHVDIGAELLIQTRTLGHLAPLVFASHEWFNGGGYPLGLAGGAIPIGSRIIAVADAYDAMTQDRRSYRRCNASETAVAEIRNGAHQQFDPAIVDVFLAVLARH